MTNDETLNTIREKFNGDVKAWLHDEMKKLLQDELKKCVQEALKESEKKEAPKDLRQVFGETSQALPLKLTTTVRAVRFTTENYGAIIALLVSNMNAPLEIWSDETRLYASYNRSNDDLTVTLTPGETWIVFSRHRLDDYFDLPFGSGPFKSKLIPTTKGKFWIVDYRSLGEFYRIRDIENVRIKSDDV